MKFKLFVVDISNFRFHLLALLALTSHLSEASCHIEETQRLRFTLPDITVNTSSGAGTILAQKTLEVDKGSDNHPFICIGKGEVKARTRFDGRKAHGIYETNTKGIGFRLFYNEHPFPWTFSQNCQGTSCKLPWPGESRVTFQLVQTLPKIDLSEAVHPGLYGWIRPDGGKSAVLINLTRSVHVRHESCSVQDTRVDFGDIYIENNEKPGKILDSKKFTIHYQCQNEGKVLTRLEGPATKEGYLYSPSLDEKGVAILLKDGRGKRLFMNKDFVTYMQEDEINFKADLISTKKITEGAFNSTVTLHFIYP